jgi:hypothetical protein
MLFIGEHDDLTPVLIESRKLADDDYRVSLCVSDYISQSREYSEEDAERQFDVLIQMVYVLAKGRKIVEADK